MAQQSLSYVLAERPKGDIIPGQTFKAKSEKAPTAEDLKDGQILIETLYLALDPAMRGWLNDLRSYVPPVKIGEVMRGGALARVLASRSGKAKAGDLVYAMTGWREIAIASEKLFEPPLALPSNAKPTDLLGVLGMTGLTAYFGMFNIGEPKPGETVVVSGAAGATGSVAGQLAKIMGARVVGIAGSDEKVQWLKEELGFDDALNYKDPDFKKKFKEATPKFIDVFWDNVGGEQLNMALGRAAKFARFVMCGGISQYNTRKLQGPPNIINVIPQRVKMQGFIVFDHTADFPKARKELAQWMSEGKLRRQETIVKGGLRSAEQALVDLYKGVNKGKLLVEVKNPDERSKL